MRKLTLVVSTAALAMSGTAIAQTAPAPRAPTPDMTRAEAAFARMDANRDGTLNAADRTARQAGMFDRLDADRNGSISRAEFDAMHAKRADRGDKAGQRVARKGRGGMMGGAQPTTRQAFVDRALTMFDRADANRDGTVTQAERKTARDTMRQQWRARGAARQQG